MPSTRTRSGILPQTSGQQQGPRRGQPNPARGQQGQSRERGQPNPKRGQQGPSPTRGQPQGPRPTRGQPQGPNPTRGQQGTDLSGQQGPSPRRGQQQSPSRTRGATNVRTGRSHRGRISGRQERRRIPGSGPQLIPPATPPVRASRGAVPGGSGRRQRRGRSHAGKKVARRNGTERLDHSTFFDHGITMESRFAQPRQSSCLARTLWRSSAFAHFWVNLSPVFQGLGLTLFSRLRHRGFFW